MSSADASVPPSRDLLEFFEKVMMDFWMCPTGPPLDVPYAPVSESGTIECAILRTHGIVYDDTASDQIERIEAIFPRESKVVWRWDAFIGKLSGGTKVVSGVTTPQVVNEFLMNGSVRERLREVFPNQLQAMEVEERRRKAESPPSE